MKHHMRVVWGSFALLVALFIVMPAIFAAPTFRSTGNNGQPMSLTLLETKCSNAKVLAHIINRIRPELIDQLKNATLYWEGKSWASCWVEVDGVVYSMDEEGAPLQPIPRSAFLDNSV